MICNRCLRDIPTEEYKTFMGCVWCDADFARINEAVKTLPEMELE